MNDCMSLSKTEQNPDPDLGGSKSDGSGHQQSTDQMRICTRKHSFAVGKNYLKGSRDTPILKSRQSV
jgi:hypothetical protein